MIIKVFLIILITTTICFADSGGKTGAAFIQLPSSAKVASLANTYTAMGDDSDGINYNPAILSRCDYFEISVLYYNYFMDLNYGSLKILKPFSYFTLCAGMDLLWQDKTEIFDDTGALKEEMEAYDLKGSVGIAKKIYGIHSGLTFHYIYSKMGDKNAKSVAFDTGFLKGINVFKLYKYRPKERNLFLGLSVRNIGPDIKYIEKGFPLPSETALGINYVAFQDYQNKIEIGTDIVKPFYNDLYYNMAVQYGFKEMAFIRAGYSTKSPENNLSTGIGFNLPIKSFDINIDYSFLPYKSMNNTHMIGLKIRQLEIIKGFIKIINVEIKDIFPASYKNYTDSPLGYIEFYNNIRSHVEGLKVSVYIEGLMDTASESEYPDFIEPGDTIRMPLYVAFNREILEIQESRPVNIKLGILYNDRKGKKEFSKTITGNILSRNALLWDDVGRLAAFITPNNKAVREYSVDILETGRSFKTEYYFSDNLQKAILLFDSLGVLGINYIPDPNSKFRNRAGEMKEVDYVQYPEELLHKGNGDCEDGSILFCSVLESVGINTGIVDAGDHIFMIFDSGFSEDEAGTFFEDAGKFVMIDGKAWVPVETTMYGNDFKEAWFFAADIYQDNMSGLKIYTLAEMREKYAEGTYTGTESVTLPDKSGLKRFYIRDVNEIGDHFLNIKIRYLIKQTIAEPENTDLYNQLARKYCEIRRYTLAIEVLKKAVRLAPKNKNYRKNLATVYLLNDDIKSAIKTLEEILKLDPEDMSVYNKLLKLYEQTGNQEAVDRIDRRLNKMIEQ